MGMMRRPDGKQSTIFIIVLLAIAVAAGVVIGIIGRPARDNGLIVSVTGSVGGSRSNNPNAGTAPSAQPGKITIIAVGDIMLSRTVGQKIREHGASYPFEKTSVILTSGDFAFGNLETSITAGPAVKSGTMMFRADPGVEQALKENEFDILSLANNHTPNYGQKGLLDTFEYLRGAGIEYVGAGRNAEEARKPIIIERSGLRIAFLAYNDTDVVPASYEASAGKAGTAFMDLATLTDGVEAAKQQSDVVIVSMHSGTEYTPGPNARQTAFAHAAIDAGAELVIGHHPHVVQSVEEYHGKLIIYSLGNFIFDQMWSVETQQGVIAKITLSGPSMSKVDFTPVMIEDYAQPRLATGDEISAILSRLQLDKIQPSSTNWVAED